MQVLSNSNSTRRCTGLVVSILSWDESRWIPDRQAGDITVYSIYIYIYIYIRMHTYITLHCIAWHYIALHYITLHIYIYIYIYMCVCNFCWLQLGYHAAVRVRHLCPVPVAKLARLDGPDFCLGFVMKRFGWMGYIAIGTISIGRWNKASNLVVMYFNSRQTHVFFWEWNWWNIVAFWNLSWNDVLVKPC